MEICKHCGEPIQSHAEATAYGGRHEDCWVGRDYLPQPSTPGSTRNNGKSPVESLLGVPVAVIPPDPDEPECKSIGGSVYFRLPCQGCGSLVWFSTRERDMKKRFCDGCFESKLHPTTGGGKRIIRKGEEFS